MIDGTALNVHGTAIVFGTVGLLFVGPSGSGKTMLALSLIDAMKAAGRHAVLIADDQVMISTRHGRAIARAPESIRGLAEIRGSGIVSLETGAAAVLDFVLRPVKSPFEHRLPPANERFNLGGDFTLPLLRLAHGDGIDVFANLKRILRSEALL